MTSRSLLVTGAASGIGLAFARCMGSKGHRLCLLDKNPVALDLAADTLRGEGIEVHARAVDVADREAVREALAGFPHIDHLGGVAAFAGTAASGAAEDISDEQWSIAIDSSLKGSLVTCQAAFPYLKASGSASIVLVGSTASLGGFAARANYSAAKSGLVGLTKTLAIEWGRYGIRVNLIAPGSIWTERAAATIPEVYARDVIIDRTPLARHGKPEEVASVADFLLSDASAFVTGAVLPVDGGLSAGYLTHESGADLGGLRNR
jgi:3-oxoacyl-[acyl-carrier protein] reductase